MRKILYIILPFFIAGCSPSVRDIEYGKEQCHYCRMTVIDHQHAAQAVTDKGKVFVFDAIECMVNYLQHDGADIKFAHLVVCDYENPGVLISTEAATFLISKSLPSPMGANLSAFGKESTALGYSKAKTGETYSWSELRQFFHYPEP